MEEPLEPEKIRSAIESLIFTSDKPIFIDDIKKLFDNLEAPKIRELIESLQKELIGRSSGLRVIEIAGGFQMVTSPDNAEVIKSYYKIKHTEKLSGPSLETLSIIAYKQPVTRIDIEAIRGVNADGVIKSLLEKNLIRIAGRKEVIGRPFVYGTTRLFLDYFGLKSLAELPKIEEFAQQDILLDVKLASGEGDITPLSKEEEEQLQIGEQDANQKDP
ncbi:MAG: SMC-Scp complex subunit ScpB [Candidatus Omnitrophica bacterium CG1_02_44_16]|nr:MAG: SMC-Scp complex subunit ScpB [Candidatus Omnitrophica bacterium CG1_02_44_16]PIY83182.1 MAG: SMC-Scp complex subunit ScpB [Candidatus Omnitrophica bacterium CG_4_10_14_0_8_um_filter_44_12]PIZ83072.1 MAG: SMC-Scp complex subunit ScpB [Candidatus Omnitrophica bacterium CG_4_10_14_0_2_um_filter_44_9]